MQQTGGEILVVDDNPGDIGLWLEAFEDIGIPAQRILAASDGMHAFQMLLNRDGGQLPALVISDARLPILSGLQLAKRMADTPLLARVPVVIVSGSAPSSANAASPPWFEKPGDYASLRSLASLLQHRFLAGVPVSFPSGPAGRP